MTEDAQPRLMQGNEACTEGALAAGLGFYAGYPITPTSRDCGKGSDFLDELTDGTRDGRCG